MTMRKILLFGNSGSGKSTLAKELCQAHGIAHLDLDTLAWQATTPPTRKTLAESAQAIQTFIDDSDGWVIEGCYTDLLELAVYAANEIIYMNLPVADCIANAKSRPWEPHKYPSKEAQDANLELLLNWIDQYSVRKDTFSQSAHQAFYDSYDGMKRQYKNNNRNIG